MNKNDDILTKLPKEALALYDDCERVLEEHFTRKSRAKKHEAKKSSK